jgi:hypothetical protein
MGRPLFPTAERSKEIFGSMASDAASRAIAGLGRSASTLGSALAFPITAAQQAVSGQPLISTSDLGRGRFGEPPISTTGYQPSSRPQAVVPSKSGSTAAMPNFPPMPSAPVAAPTLPNVGMGIMGNQNVGPLPTEQFSPMARIAPTLADRGNVTTDITGMQGKTPIQTPYGTVYATAQQAGTDRVAEMANLPAQSARLANIGEQAQRGAAIAQMRERGAALAQQRFGAQESFFAQRRAERDALRSTEATARAGGTRPMDIMKARELVAGPSTIAGIQQQATIGPMSPVGTTVSRFAGALPEGGSRPLPSGAMGASGYALAEQMQSARRALGATGPYSNAGAERRKRNRQEAQARGFQAPYSTGAQEAFEKYLRRQNEA